jgi:hypothetical protein
MKNKRLIYGSPNPGEYNKALKQAYMDFRETVKNHGVQIKEVLNVNSFRDFKLAESIFNSKYRKYRHILSTTTVKDKKYY